MEKSKVFVIEPYGMTFELVVTVDMLKLPGNRERNLVMDDSWGQIDCRGMMVYKDWWFVVMLNRNSGLTHEIIAHEIFHATHHMLSHCELKFRPKDHEAFAFTNGHLTKLVYAQLKKWKIRVK
jgi:hypothetical protein